MVLAVSTGNMRWACKHDMGERPSFGCIVQACILQNKYHFIFRQVDLACGEVLTLTTRGTVQYQSDIMGLLTWRESPCVSESAVSQRSPAAHPHLLHCSTYPLAEASLFLLRFRPKHSCSSSIPPQPTCRAYRHSHHQLTLSTSLAHWCTVPCCFVPPPLYF